MPNQTRSTALPAVALGLTFLFIGLTFALPLQLVPEREHHVVSEHLSPEVINVYACVAWAGWAHFIFAFRGQRNALARLRDEFKGGRIFAYAACTALIILTLLGLRWAAGAGIFGAVVWVYFIDHFIKAEQHFEGKSRTSGNLLTRWLTSYQPLLTFSWLSVVLLNVGGITSHSWALWSASLLLALVVLGFGGWRGLKSPDFRSPLLSLFFLGEALVWGAFGRYGGPMFLTGVYVFHIAAGSYFHYLGSYFAASSNAKSKDTWLTPLSIIAVNALILTIGFFVANQASLSWLRPIFGIEWFTLWVGVHLVSSDVFPFIKKWKTSPAMNQSG